MAMRKTTILLVVLALLVAQSAFAVGNTVQSPLSAENAEYTYASQLGIEAASMEIPEESVLLAVGSADYPVTPGDKYMLSYYDGKTLSTLNLQADTECFVSIPSFGTVEAAGMSFMEFKKHVEDMVSTYYPYSSPQLTLVSCGLFNVRVSGAVKYSQYVTAWGLSRLSDLAPYANDYASTRAVKVIYSNGTEKTYDLLKALRSGSLTDNPLLTPGCEVIFTEAESIVSISGAVKRPGVYQPLAGESLNDMVTKYCGGFLVSADKGSISVTRYSDGEFVAQSMDEAEAKAYVPSDGDSIAVAYNTQSLPYITITGAITQSDDLENALASANKVTYRFVPGETALQLVRNISYMLTSTSDTAAMYILRNGEKIPVDASSALSSNDKGDVVLQQGDTVVIPFSQLTVTVLGAVVSPGTFSYVPDRSAEYYINLAKGFNSDATQRYKVLDRNGNKVKDDVVPADSTIVVDKSNLTTNIALVASVLSIVSTVLTIVINTHVIAGYSW